MGKSPTPAFQSDIAVEHRSANCIAEETEGHLSAIVFSPTTQQISVQQILSSYCTGQQSDMQAYFFPRDNTVQMIIIKRFLYLTCLSRSKDRLISSVVYDLTCRGNTCLYSYITPDPVHQYTEVKGPQCPTVGPAVQCKWSVPGRKVNLHSKMFWREKYIPCTVTQKHTVIRSFTAQPSRVNVTQFHVLLYGAHSVASCLCVLSPCAVFCIDPRVVVVQQLMQQRAGGSRRVRCICWPDSEHRSQ